MKIAFINEGKIKTFSDKGIIREFGAKRPTLRLLTQKVFNRREEIFEGTFEHADEERTTEIVTSG